MSNHIENFQKDIVLLNQINPQEKSLSLSKNQKDLVISDKRSCFRNFLSWIIHIITFTLVPRNSELDKVTQRILDGYETFGKEHKFTFQEKEQIIKAVQNLKKITEKNGGSQVKKIDQLLGTIQKIQKLEVVTSISNASIQNPNTTVQQTSPTQQTKKPIETNEQVPLQTMEPLKIASNENNLSPNKTTPSNLEDLDREFSSYFNDNSQENFDQLLDNLDKYDEVIRRHFINLNQSNDAFQNSIKVIFEKIPTVSEQYIPLIDKIMDSLSEEQISSLKLLDFKPIIGLYIAEKIKDKVELDHTIIMLFTLEVNEEIDGLEEETDICEKIIQAIKSENNPIVIKRFFNQLTKPHCLLSDDERAEILNNLPSDLFFKYFFFENHKEIFRNSDRYEKQDLVVKLENNFIKSAKNQELSYAFLIKQPTIIDLAISFLYDAFTNLEGDYPKVKELLVELEKRPWKLFAFLCTFPVEFVKPFENILEEFPLCNSIYNYFKKFEPDFEQIKIKNFGPELAALELLINNGAIQNLENINSLAFQYLQKAIIKMAPQELAESLNEMTQGEIFIALIDNNSRHAIEIVLKNYSHLLSHKEIEEIVNFAKYLENVIQDSDIKKSLSLFYNEIRN